MVKSMTGYGREVAAIGETRVTVEVRTVNHRFLDLSIKMPKMLLYVEEKIKKQARTYFTRGRVDVMVTIEGEGLVNRKLHIDWPLLDQYIEKMELLKNRYHLSESVTIQDIVQLEDAFSIVEQEKTDNEFETLLLQTCDRALKKSLEMRQREGEVIFNDLQQRVLYIQSIVQKLDRNRDFIMEEYRKRIRNRIEEYLNDELREDDRKVIQEVALLAEKGDITEEVTRLFSHIDQFIATLQKNESIGRKLDFIIQEMHREINTIGSKSNDGHITEWVVNVKSEVEKLKEQIQNVE